MPRLAVVALGLLALAMVAADQVPSGLRDTGSASRAQAERILDSYFAAMRSHDFSDVPFTSDAVFRGSLHTDPVKGESAVRTFLVAVANGARNVQPKWRVIDGERACVHYEYQTNTGAVVPVVACFRFEAGRIAEERAFFDPRPFLTPQSGNDTTGPNTQARNQFLFSFGDMITQTAPPGELIHILGGESAGFQSLSLVISETKPHGGPPLHRHLCEEAHVLLAGTVKYTIGPETFVAQAPYVVRIPAGVCHKFESLGDKTINVIGVFPKSRENEVDPEGGPRCEGR